MRKITNIIAAFFWFPVALFASAYLRYHGWTLNRTTGKWQKTMTYGTDTWTDCHTADGAFEEIQKERESIKWNPWNKVVQDCRTGRVDHRRTNKERKKRGLPTPWHPNMARAEMRKERCL